MGRILNIGGPVLVGDINEIVTTQTVVNAFMIYHYGRKGRGVLKEAIIKYLFNPEKIEEDVALSLLALTGLPAHISKVDHSIMSKHVRYHPSIKFNIYCPEETPMRYKLNDWLNSHKGEYLYATYMPWVT